MTEREAAQRYHWFITMGYRTTVLNDPLVILDKANADYVDRLIVEGMKRWPLRQPPEPLLPKAA